MCPPAHSPVVSNARCLSHNWLTCSIVSISYYFHRVGMHPSMLSHKAPPRPDWLTGWRVCGVRQRARSPPAHRLYPRPHTRDPQRGGAQAAAGEGAYPILSCASTPTLLGTSTVNGRCRPSGQGSGAAVAPPMRGRDQPPRPPTPAPTAPAPRAPRPPPCTPLWPAVRPRGPHPAPSPPETPALDSQDPECPRLAKYQPGAPAAHGIQHRTNPVLGPMAGRQ